MQSTTQHISVECPFCHRLFLRHVLDFQGERKYKLLRAATCPHCTRVIVVNSRLLVIDPVPAEKPRREVVEIVSELIDHLIGPEEML